RIDPQPSGGKPHPGRLGSAVRGMAAMYDIDAPISGPETASPASHAGNGAGDFGTEEGGSRPRFHSLVLFGHFFFAFTVRKSNSSTTCRGSTRYGVPFPS